MIGLDTNILVRYLTRDDLVQSGIAYEVIERRLSIANPGFITIVVIVELAWVLDRTYGFLSHDIASVLERLLQAETLVIEHAAEVFAAMTMLRDGIGSFSDSLIAELGWRAGCERTLTFDRRALRINGFAMP